MKKQLILHIGTHKTASTAIQKKLLHIEDDVKVISVHEKDRAHYVDFRIKFSRIIFDFEKGKIAAPEIDKKCEELANLFNNYLSGFKQNKIIWSDENLLGSPVGHRIANSEQFNYRLYPASGLVASAFALLKNTYDIRVLTVLRRQDYYIESCYRDWVIKLDTALTFEQFIEPIKWQDLSWHKVVSPWLESFLAENVKILCYEELNEDPDYFFDKVFSWLGVTVVATGSNKVKKINKGLSNAHIALANAMIFHLSPEDKAMARSFIKSIAGNNAYVLYHDKQRTELLSKLTGENSLLKNAVDSTAIEEYLI